MIFWSTYGFQKQKVRYNMKLSIDERPIATVNFIPTTQGKSSSSVLTSGAGMSSAPSSAASQHSQTPGFLKYIIRITPNAGLASYTQYLELIDEAATSCKFCTTASLLYIPPT